ncbi:uncharacterized protein BDZ83DRAFT_637268 [Colletotrichum acutatum]|uniref:Uncharacterized protein n=1 Tax=Glomerella acutata TaxID=27357 RepID=A0AAD8UEC8_GLOAC|nr:uncharacterized protein BDZ83DRAFT_637268 [Colletotrichum acutatum]KAK1713786.1 hypothetical protein BDZ83DRAFT_637268 [Colletotrichum acutatum]
MPIGRSRLPTSVAGFMAPKMRKLGCALILSISPVSDKRIEGVSTGPVSRSAMASKVSGDAKLISSRSTQSPFRAALIMLPSTNENANAVEPPDNWTSNCSRLLENLSQRGLSSMRL